VVCAQNHDQVGNRARGDRLSHLVGPDAAGVAAAVTLLGPTTPLLFQGEEWAATSPFPFFTDFRDPALSEAVREGRRRELGDLIGDSGGSFDPVAEATRDLAVLRWDEREAEPHARVLDWYRTLVRLRRVRPELADPDPYATRARLRADGRVLAMDRGSIAVVANLSGIAAPDVVPFGRLLASWPDASPEAEADRAGDCAALPPYGVRVVQRTT
jgi:maltooligosyltrehalose trehalohydrolase